MKLTRKQHEQARAYIYAHARPLEQALYAYHFEGGTVEAVFDQLASYQNADGGFGHALEPDLRTAASSTIATTVGLQILRELRAPSDHALVQDAMQYLVTTYDQEQQRWPIIPPRPAQHRTHHGGSMTQGYRSVSASSWRIHGQKSSAIYTSMPSLSLRSCWGRFPRRRLHAWNSSPIPWKCTISCAMSA